MPRPISLLETLRLENGTVPRLEGHLRRLARSANYFGYHEVDRAIADLRRAVAALASDHPVGLFRLSVGYAPWVAPSVRLTPHLSDERPRTLRIAHTPVDSADPALYHKLADRTTYQDRAKEAAGADDVIMVNERGELTETTIGNLVLEVNGRRLTPALACGLLPGVFRAELLGSGEIEEAILRPEDLKRATRVWMVNSLRGWVECVRLGS